MNHLKLFSFESWFWKITSFVHNEWQTVTSIKLRKKSQKELKFILQCLKTNIQINFDQLIFTLIKQTFSCNQLMSLMRDYSTKPRFSVKFPLTSKQGLVITIAWRHPAKALLNYFQSKVYSGISAVFVGPRKAWWST